MLEFSYNFHNKDEYYSIVKPLKCKNISCRPVAMKRVYLVHNPWNLQGIILQCYAAINTLLTCREHNLFIFRGNPIFYVCFFVACICSDSQHHLMAEGLFLRLGIPWIHFLEEVNTWANWCHFWCSAGQM